MAQTQQKTQKKNTGLIIGAVVVVVVLLVALVARSRKVSQNQMPDNQSSAAEQVATDNEAGQTAVLALSPEMATIAGDYKLLSMTNGEEKTTQEDLEVFRALGLNSSLILLADGTGEIDLFGNASSLAWNETTITMGEEFFDLEAGETLHEADRMMTFVYDSDTITIGEDDSRMIFKRKTAEDYEAEENAAELNLNDLLRLNEAPEQEPVVAEEQVEEQVETTVEEEAD